MKATAILIISLVAGLCLFSCNDTQSFSDPLKPSGIGQQKLMKPRPIEITTHLCAGNDLSTTVGTWEASGLFADAGDASSQATGHGPTLPPNLVEGELVLESSVGTVTIRFVEPFVLPNPGFPVIGVREGTWVILHGTGGYSNLHGQGTITIWVSVDIVEECGGPPTDLKIFAELNGTAHFAP
jgi:hypothetical protein